MNLFQLVCSTRLATSFRAVALQQHQRRDECLARIFLNSTARCPPTQAHWTVWRATHNDWQGSKTISSAVGEVATVLPKFRTRSMRPFSVCFVGVCGTCAKILFDLTLSTATPCLSFSPISPSLSHSCDLLRTSCCPSAAFCRDNRLIKRAAVQFIRPRIQFNFVFQFQFSCNFYFNRISFDLLSASNNDQNNNNNRNNNLNNSINYLVLNFNLPAALKYRYRQSYRYRYRG